MLGFSPRAIVFDMDGLLLDTERLTVDAMEMEAAARGLVVRDGLFLSLVGIDETGSRRLLAEAFGSGFSYEDFRTGYRGRVREQVRTGMPMRPGARAMVEAAKAAGMPLAVATSSWLAQAGPHLEQAGVRPLLDALVTRDDVANPKPAPEPYLLAAARLGVEPAEVLALEDSHSGVRSAAAAGMAVVMVPDLLPATGEMRRLARAVADDLHQVRGWLGLAHADDFL
ncbi:HAD family phosphatase [Sandaracinobacter sp. RS1-74]|uniref:HAD family hydrolase n=1 Tax=Sandaracinobacteroides sayramensis TaxID=2913411 RepID=UPI001EDA4453|nr:HAD family phosphatase [Sandaracinobacteroides sayramensis]MCG2841412.1 HAD family phosphatase [Sandaracinobacteroides sayramensis]